jgi:hypothetical protein
LIVAASSAGLVLVPSSFRIRFKKAIGTKNTLLFGTSIAVILIFVDTIIIIASFERIVFTG